MHPRSFLPVKLPVGARTVIGLYAGACQKTEAVMRVKTFEIKTIGNKRIQRI